MRRAWDIIVGLVMILGSLVAQAVVIFLVASLLLAAVLPSERWVWLGDAIILVALNLLTFATFRRNGQPRVTLGLGGAFFLLPRGIFRIVYGRERWKETEADQANSRPGFPIRPNEDQLEIPDADGR